jgi:hypothetical protein
VTVPRAGTQGPAQFLASTFAGYGQGDVRSSYDSILAAGVITIRHNSACTTSA